MRNVLKGLNDRSPSEVRTLDEEELRRFEALCECWSKIAEAELARRRALPRSNTGTGAATQEQLLRHFQRTISRALVCGRVHEQ
jgi:hypothetical protein